MAEHLPKLAASRLTLAALQALLSHQRSPAPVRIVRSTLAHDQPLSGDASSLTWRSPSSRVGDDTTPNTGARGKVISAVSGPIYSKPYLRATRRL